MYLISQFEGDDNKELALMQHGVYSQALGTIVSLCNHHAIHIKAIPPDANHKDWGKIDRFDHRTLQTGHDLLAAVWRYRNRSFQMNLPFEGAQLASLTEWDWLGWLNGKIYDWVHMPWMVRSVQMILTNQNQPLGLLAESELSLEIMVSFPDVPWLRDWRNALEETACQHWAEFDAATTTRATEKHLKGPQE